MGWGALVPVVALSLWVLPAAGQATITVNTTADNTTAGDTFCTLREALTNANSNSDTTGGDCDAGVGTTDTIAFTINGGGSLATIQPTSALPTITQGVTIDGTTQGCAGSVPCIELDGTNAGAVSGLVITGSNSTIAGLVINRFGGQGVVVSGSGSGNAIVGNYIGTNATGTADLGNTQHGVFIAVSASNNTIGGTAAGAGNVISGNDQSGVRIEGNLNQVQGNYIGTDATGAADLGNTQQGVLIGGGATNNTIGGMIGGARNVISGNNSSGVRIEGGTTTGNRVWGNYIGTDVNGTADLGNTEQGVLITAGASTNDIGAADASARNVISGNNFSGVQIEGGTTTGNLVQGNYIGTDATGTTDLGNNQHGVLIRLGASNNSVGGTTAGARNVISGNNFSGVQIEGSTTTGNALVGNYIGTDVNGTADLGNAQLGVRITDGASSNSVGSASAGARNVISGNNINGVLIDGTGTTGNTVQGNYIGTDATGAADLGNNQLGVLITAGASNNTIGGTTAGARNVISGNNSSGVQIANSGTTGNTVQGNYIGTDATGAADLGNTQHGVLINGGAVSNAIGGTTAGARNVISGNNFSGVQIEGSTTTGNTVQGNYIGTDATGTTDLGNNQHGVLIRLGASNNTIGGTAAGARNVISGNNFTGVNITNSGTTGNTVQGNYIGTDATGTADLGNTQQGVRITAGASNNTIGGTAGGARNVISGNNQDGVRMEISGTTGNTVQGNYIGTDATGTADLGNGDNGVLITVGASNNTVGGTVAGARNVISGNNRSGVRIENNGTTGNLVQGNYIGTDAGSTIALGNTLHGVLITIGASNNTIGGTTAGARNVISGNNSDGVLIIGILGSGTTDNVVQGNYIGTDAGGTIALGNTQHGVTISGVVSGNTIGGTTAGARNVISGNNGSGVAFTSFVPTGNMVQGNYIGTDVTGTAGLGNTQHGVLIDGGAISNTIGGTAAGAANTIAFNGLDGVVLTSFVGTGNAIRHNSLFSNDGLGIDLDDDGVTPNDPGDPDASPNNLQNFPTVTSALIDGSGDLLVTYLVDTDPANATYPLSVEVFEADADDEEGQTFLGSDTYTNGDHPGTRQVNLGGAAALGVSPGDRLVATATDDDGNTSEFNASVVVSPVTRYVTTTGNDTGNDCTNPGNPCATLTHAIEQANAGDTIDMAAGTYPEPGLVIDKALHIQGQGVVVQ